MSGAFLISIRTPCLDVRDYHPRWISNRATYLSSSRYDAESKEKLQEPARDFTDKPSRCWVSVRIRVNPWLRRFTPQLNTSRTFRERLCRVNGFCRNALPLSRAPSLTMVSSVYPER